MNLGKRIEAERKRRGWTQTQVANLVPGLTQQALDQLEKRDSKSSAHTMGIATAFEMTVEQLMTGAAAMAQPITTAPPKDTPTLADALELLGIELAREMPDDVRQDAADTLAKLALRKGAERHQAELLTLLSAPPGKQQGAA